jgi:pimeloyl-ACP methyl ester carboxylesterase
MQNKIAIVRSGQFQWRGYALAYEVWGDKGTPCLLMHGLLLDSLMNRDLARRFVAAGYQVALLDFLGHGASDKPVDAREHRIDFLGDQALACLDHLGWDQALVGGVSLGANAALSMATQAPERCLGLFIEMPVMEQSVNFAGAVFLPLVMASNFLPWAIRPFARGMRRLPRPRWESAASVMNALSTEPAMINAVLHGLLVGPIVPAAYARRKLQMPTLIIGHGWDALHELRDAKGLAQELPNAQLVKAASILELRVRPQRLWPAIERFLQSLNATARKRTLPKARSKAKPR